MTNMRRGFTMIELIFVIVIIGILAAVAIPKLAATRDDAKISKIVANTRTFVEDVKNYYAAHGAQDWASAKVPDVTDVPVYTDNTCGTQAGSSTAISGSPAKFYMCDDIPKDVIEIDVNATHVEVKNGTSTSTQIASGVQNDPAIVALKNAQRIGGISVTR